MNGRLFFSSLTSIALHLSIVALIYFFHFDGKAPLPTKNDTPITVSLLDDAPKEALPEEKFLLNEIRIELSKRGIYINPKRKPWSKEVKERLKEMNIILALTVKLALMLMKFPATFRIYQV